MGHVRNHHVIVEAALTRGRPSQTSLKRILRHNIRSRFTEEGALPTQMIPGRDKRASAPKTMVLHGNRAMLHLLVESCGRVPLRRCNPRGSASGYQIHTCFRYSSRHELHLHRGAGGPASAGAELSSVWCLSRRILNQRAHALNGNG